VSERITSTRIANWLSETITNKDSLPIECVAVPPVMPDFPDEIVIVTLLPGTGLDHERAFEVRTFQIRCRSPQNVPEYAEFNSIMIDNHLMSMMMPWKPDGAFVNELGWTGGGPAPLPADDSSNRYSWVCSYYCKAATGY
jgi:hypothetical protein